MARDLKRVLERTYAEIVQVCITGLEISLDEDDVHETRLLDAFRCEVSEKFALLMWWEPRFCVQKGNLSESHWYRYSRPEWPVTSEIISGRSRLFGVENYTFSPLWLYKPLIGCCQPLRSGVSGYGPNSSSKDGSQWIAIPCRCKNSRREWGWRINPCIYGKNNQIGHSSGIMKCWRNNMYESQRKTSHSNPMRLYATKRELSQTPGCNANHPPSQCYMQCHS